MDFVVIGYDIDFIDDILQSGSNIVGYMSKSKKIDDSFGLEYLGDVKNGYNFNFKSNLLLIADDIELREFCLANLPNIVTQYVSAKSYVSKYAKLGLGTIVGPNCYVSAGTKIGSLVKLGINSYIHHEVQISNCSVIAPSCVILGKVQIGNSVYIGSHSSIKQEITIGSKSLVGMGSNVSGNIPANVIAYGNPCKPQKSLL